MQRPLCLMLPSGAHSVPLFLLPPTVMCWAWGGVSSNKTFISRGNSMFSFSHNTGIDTRGSFEVSHQDLEALLRGAHCSKAFLPTHSLPLMPKSHNSLWTLQKMPCKERAQFDPLPTKWQLNWVDQNLGVICIITVSYYAAKQEGHAFMLWPQLQPHSNKTSL